MDESSNLSSSTTIKSSLKYPAEKKCSLPAKELNPMDEKVKIQNERIVAIMNEIIGKTEIAIFLLHNDDRDEMIEVFRNTLTGDEFNKIVRVLNHSPSFNDLNIEHYHDIHELDIQEVVQRPSDKIFPELSHVFWIIMKYSQLKLYIKERIKQIRGIENTDRNELLHYLDTLIMFRNKLKEKIYTSAEDKLKKEFLFRQLVRANGTLVANITDLTNKINAEKQKFQSIFNKKQATIDKHKNEINDIEKDCNNTIAEKLMETQKKLEKLKQYHMSTVNILEQKYNESEEQYEKLLVENMNSEDELRLRRIEMEEEVLNWLVKYDREVGGKHTTLDELKKNYGEEERQYNELKKKFDEQEAIYVPMMAEKQADYEREVLGKMKAFLREHAARVLQRTWRKILAARAEKKKKKGGGKKKKGKKKRKSKSKSPKPKSPKPKSTSNTNPRPSTSKLTPKAKPKKK